MTEARREQFYAAVPKDQETAKKLLAMTPEEVVSYMAGEGCDFTLEEIKELGAEIQKQLDAIKSGELKEEDLMNVAGGSNHALWFSAGMMTVGVAAGVVLCGW